MTHLATASLCDNHAKQVSILISKHIPVFWHSFCLHELDRFTFEAPMPTSRLVRDVADRAQIGTQRSWKRPWGVGLLVAGTDKNGVKLFYNCPSGNFYDYKAMAIGGRSQVILVYG